MVLDSKTVKQIFLHHHLDVFQMQLKQQVLKVPLFKLAKIKDQNLLATWVEALHFGKINLWCLVIRTALSTRLGGIVASIFFCTKILRSKSHNFPLFHCASYSCFFFPFFSLHAEVSFRFGGELVNQVSQDSNQILTDGLWHCVPHGFAYLGKFFPRYANLWEIQCQSPFVGIWSQS